MKVQGLEDWTIGQLREELRILEYAHVEQVGEFDDVWIKALRAELERRGVSHEE